MVREPSAPLNAVQIQLTRSLVIHGHMYSRIEVDGRKSKGSRFICRNTGGSVEILCDFYIGTKIGDGRTLGFVAFGGFFEVESRRIWRSNCSSNIGVGC